ncbi:MAG: polysaccharide biosynthesis protein [Candidatus Omnitrophota bacterium]
MNAKKKRLQIKTVRAYPGVPLLHFRFLFKKAEEAIKTFGEFPLASPYSVIPLISQAMGLEIPMMGSGRSPYSIVAYFSGRNKGVFLSEKNPLPHQKRREIIDEIYEMLAPYLLDEEEDYIDLVMSTKYKKEMQGLRQEEIEKVKNILVKKFSILDKVFSKMKFVGGNFSHIAHYGYPDDLYREQSFLKYFDETISRRWRENSYPIVTEMQLDGYNAPNKCIKGWYIFIPNYTEELLKSKALRQKKLLQAGRLAKALNAKFSGMAGLIASFSKGGEFFKKNVENFGFTTGHAYTVANICEMVKNVVKEFSLDLSKSKVAIVGASGSIGSGVAKLIAENLIREILIVDRPNMVASVRLDNLKNILQQKNPKNKVKASKNIEDIKDSDLIIIATNSLVSIIKAEYLKAGAVIIDDSFPKNVARDILKERDDIVLLEGGVTQMPKVNIDVSRHMPDLLDLSISKLISCSQAYGCLAETFILAALGHVGNYGLGDADPDLAKDIMSKGKRLSFSNAVLQNYGFAIEESRIKKVRKIIRSRNK